MECNAPCHATPHKDTHNNNNRPDLFLPCTQTTWPDRHGVISWDRGILFLCFVFSGPRLIAIELEFFFIIIIIGNGIAITMTYIHPFLEWELVRHTG